MDYIEFEHILDAPHHPQSQGVFEVFNKTGKKALSKANDKTKSDKNNKLDPEFNLHHFLHYNN